MEERPALTVASLRCNIQISVHRARDKKLLRVIRTKNLMVRSGRRQLRDLIMYPLSAGPVLPAEEEFGTPATPNYIEVGSSGTAVADTQETLLGPVFRKEITLRTPQTSGFKIQLYLDPSEANGSGTQELREVGLFSLITGGLLWARAIHTLINKTNLISVTYDWTFTITAS